jgi:hypothetical protein
MNGRLNALCVLELGLALLGASGCSLVKLSDDIAQAQCRKDADCEVLNVNDRMGPDFNACEPWQCGKTSYCEKLPLDADGDGVMPEVKDDDGEPLMCQQDAKAPDCDDTNSDRSPEKDERCDSLDNDCDEYVDEGVLEQKRDSVTAFTGASMTGAGEVAYAVDPDSGVVAAAYGLGDTQSVPGFSRIASDLGSGSAASELSLSGATGSLLTDSVGVGALGGDKFAVAFYNKSGVNKRLVAGVVQESGSGFELAVAPDILGNGLRCAVEEACAGGTAAVPVAAPPTTTPALAARDGEVVIAYVRGDADKANCESVTPLPVLANRMLYSAGAGELSEPGEAAVKLGETSDPNTPALLAIPAFGAAATGADVGFLVAFANVDGDVVLQQLRTESGSLVSSEPLLTLGGGDVRLSDVSLSLGLLDKSGLRVGVAVQSGCSIAARVLAFSVRVTVAKSGALSIEQVWGPTTVGGSASESRPSIAYSQPRSSWVVTYRDPSGLRARVLDGAGKALGASPYTLLKNTASGAGALQVLASPLALPLRSRDGWFGALAYTKAGPDDAASYALQSITLSSCKGK